MKKKTLLNIIIGICLLSYIVYQMWDITQTSKKNAQFKPNYLKGFIAHSEVLSQLDSATAFAIVDCFYEKFVQKYGRDKLIETDTRYGSGDTSVYRTLAEPIIDSCILPYKQKFNEARWMNSCIHSFSTNKSTKAQKKAFCSCMLENEKSKYGPEFMGTILADSMLKKDVLESGCVEELKKK